jgi:hypothetical protein
MRSIALALLATVLAAPEAQAAEPTLLALLDDGSLVVFRPGDAAGARTLQPQGISGTLVGIDRRPADGRIYGLARGTNVYAIDPETAEATLVSTLTVPFDGDARSGVDFTPQLDRLRLVSIDGRNMRVNVAIGATALDGPLAYVAGDPNAGKRPNITAAAYGNNRADVAVTTLFEIDADLDILVIQDPANDGTLKTVGPIGADVPERAGFDIVTDPSGKDSAFAAWGSTLYSIDLTTGRATATGPIPMATRPVISLTATEAPP